MLKFHLSRSDGRFRENGWLGEQKHDGWLIKQFGVYGSLVDLIVSNDLIL